MKKYSLSILGEKAREYLIEGARQVYEPVVATLGARGRNIVQWKHYQTKSIRDGVKTANSVNPKEPFENAGAEILKQSAQNQVDSVGDGTTVAIVLGYSIAKEALKLVNSGINPMALKNGLERGRDILVSEIEKLSKPIKNKKQKVQVATIASQSEELGELIGDTLDKSGVDGVVTVEEAVGPETFVEHQEGVQIDSGYRTEYFVTNPENMTATVSNAYILVTDYKLTAMNDLIPLFDNLFTQNKKNTFVVIASDIEGSVLATMVQNKLKGNFSSLAIKSPSFQMEETLRDIAMVVGAKFISKQSHLDLKTLTIDDLGYADMITSSREATVITGGGRLEDRVKVKKSIQDRITALKNQLETETQEFMRMKIKERLSRLTGGVYVIKVGGQTEGEIDDKKERIDDAVQATRSAIKGGIVAGGEVVFLAVRDKLKSKDENEEYSFRILRNALFLPFEKLVENAGFNAGELNSKLLAPQEGMGIDVTTGEMVNMFEKGIIDPSLVLITAIRNGVSVAISIICSDGIIAE